MEVHDVKRFFMLKRASKLLLAPGEPPRIRLKEGMQALDLPPLDWRALEEVVRPFFKDEQWSEFQRTGAFLRESEWVIEKGLIRISVSKEGVCFDKGNPA